MGAKVGKNVKTEESTTLLYPISIAVIDKYQYKTPVNPHYLAPITKKRKILTLGK